MKLVAPEIVSDLKIPETFYAAVKDIINHKEVDGVVYYQTRWIYQGPSQDSWLRKEDFIDYGPLQKYERNLNSEE